MLGNQPPTDRGTDALVGKEYHSRHDMQTLKQDLAENVGSPMSASANEGWLVEQGEQPIKPQPVKPQPIKPNRGGSAVGGEEFSEKEKVFVKNVVKFMERKAGTGEYDREKQLSMHEKSNSIAAVVNNIRLKAGYHHFSKSGATVPEIGDEEFSVPFIYNASVDPSGGDNGDSRGAKDAREKDVDATQALAGSSSKSDQEAGKEAGKELINGVVKTRGAKGWKGGAKDSDKSGGIAEGAKSCCDRVYDFFKDEFKYFSNARLEEKIAKAQV